MDKWTQLGRPGGAIPCNSVGDYAECAGRQPEATAAIEDLSRSIDKLDSVASEFVGRIGRALSRAETGGSNGLADPAYSSELANSIQQRATAVRQITAHLAEALARLEI